MITRLAAVVALVTATLAFAVPASADAPPGKGLVIEAGVFLCNGQPATIVHPAGATGWINGQHFVILSFTFSDPGGTFTKASGNKTGLGDAFTCVGQVAPGVTLTVVGALVPPK